MTTDYERLDRPEEQTALLETLAAFKIAIDRALEQLLDPEAVGVGEAVGLLAWESDALAGLLTRLLNDESSAWLAMSLALPMFLDAEEVDQ